MDKSKKNFENKIDKSKNNLQKEYSNEDNIEVMDRKRIDKKKNEFNT